MSQRRKKTSRQKGAGKTRNVRGSRTPPGKPTGWFLGLHHIRPSSRGGKDDSSNMYPRERWEPQYSEKHEAWHTIFVNALPQEAVDLIRSYTKNDGFLSERFFSFTLSMEQVLIDGERKDVVRLRTYRPGSEKKKQAWLLLFGDLNAEHAIEWIEREFIKKEWFNSPGSSGGLNDGRQTP